jgi:hypothetical protein
MIKVSNATRVATLEAYRPRIANLVCDLPDYYRRRAAQIALLGLLTAIDEYDPESPSFKGYAYAAMRRELTLWSWGAL